MCHVSLRLPHCFLIRRFLNVVNIFLLFSQHGKGWGLFFFFLHILQLHWNWPSGSEEDFEILLLNFRYNIFLGKGIGSSFEQTWIPFTYRYFVSSLIKIGQLVCRQCIFAIISHWKGGVPLFEDTWILLGKEWCVPSLFEIGHVFICVSEDSEENFLNCVYVFCYFVIIPIGKGCDPLLPNLNPA